MRSYGSSLNIATSLPRTRSASPFRSSSVATPPVGLCGLFRKIARGRFVAREKLPHVVQVRAEVVRRFQLGQHDARVAPEYVRRIGGEVRAEDQHGVAGVQERLAEQLLEVFRARAGDHMVARDRQSVLAIDVLGRGLPELHDAERRAVPAVAVADGLHARLDGFRRGRKRAVADLELDDVLARGHETLGDGEDAEGAFDADGRGELAEMSGIRERIIARDLTAGNMFIIYEHMNRGISIGMLSVLCMPLGVLYPVGAQPSIPSARRSRSRRFERTRLVRSGSRSRCCRAVDSTPST